jgi:hypothetical protein
MSSEPSSEHRRRNEGGTRTKLRKICAAPFRNIFPATLKAVTTVRAHSCYPGHSLNGSAFPI